MFRWLFFSENGLSPAEHAAWKLTALRIILFCGIALDLLIAIYGLAHGVQAIDPVTAILAASFFAIKLLGLYWSAHKPERAAVLLSSSIYANAILLVAYTSDFQIARFAYILIYITPIIVRIFLGVIPALTVMAVNLIPFLLMLWNQPVLNSHFADSAIPLSHLYIQSLLFILFNICLPLAVFRLLFELELSSVKVRNASKALESSYLQYQEVFQNAGTALVLTDASGRILQANHLANALLGRAPDDKRLSPLFDWLSLDDSVRLRHADELDELRQSAYRNRDGRMIALEHISQTQNEHFIVSMRDVSGLHSMQSALEMSREREAFLRRYDALTNLPNRELLRQHLQHLLDNRALEAQDKVQALVSFRLNSIRHANQQFGAHMGDILLRRFAEELNKILPKNCFCARLRSIVFSFVVEQSRTPGEIIKLVEQIRSALPKEIEVNGIAMLVRFSAGIALIRPEDDEADDLIRRCEVALDTARRSSDQSVTLFDEEDAQQIKRCVDIEVGIVNGIKQHEFRLLYQPKYNVAGEMVGLEALLRWQSESLGAVTPGEFIAIAERANLIRVLSDFVLDQVCRQIRGWLNQFGYSPVVALNLSAADITREDLTELIFASCKRYQVAPELLEFEITETGLIANESLAISHLHALKNAGFAIAIDDFGTGYSSLSKLSQFPASSLKIDRTFVAQIGQNPKSELIIKAIISLANLLACEIVAEGVETQQQESFLKQVGCDLFQGYYYNKPLEVAQIEALLRQNKRLIEALANSSAQLQIA